MRDSAARCQDALFRLQAWCASNFFPPNQHASLSHNLQNALHNCQDFGTGQLGQRLHHSMIVRVQFVLPLVIVPLLHCN